MKTSPFQATFLVLCILGGLFVLVRSIQNPPPPPADSSTTRGPLDQPVDQSILSTGYLYLSSPAKSITFTDENGKVILALKDSDDLEREIEELALAKDDQGRSSLNVDIVFKKPGEQNFMMIELDPMTGDGDYDSQEFHYRQPGDINFSTQIKW